MYATKKHYTGCYRVSDKDAKLFGQVRKNNVVNAETGSILPGWIAEIRYSETGVIKRYAGIWRTKKEAIEEVTFVLSRS